MAERKNRADSVGLASQASAVAPSAVPVIVAAARHSRRATSTSTAMAGVSLTAAASPQSTPRPRPRTSRRSTATIAMRMALTCPYSMVLGMGSRVIRAANAIQGAAPHAVRQVPPSARSTTAAVTATQIGVATVSCTWNQRSGSTVKGVMTHAANGV